MTDEQFRAFLNLLMASDGIGIDESDDTTLQGLADEEAHKRGFKTWIVAYHGFQR